MPKKDEKREKEEFKGAKIEPPPEPKRVEKKEKKKSDK